jgi:hypothetical protein
MKIAVITCTTENRKWLYEITNPSKIDFCKKHSYDFIFSDTFYPDKNKGVYWLKPAFISENISDKYDWILWLDDDAGFIKDLDLENFIQENAENYSVLAAKDDFNGFNAGVMIVKSSPEMKNTFKFIYEKMEPIYKKSKFQDQDATLKILTELNLIKYVDGHIINAYDEKLTKSKINQRTENTSILHIAGGTEFKLHNLDYIKRLFVAK